MGPERQTPAVRLARPGDIGRLQAIQLVAGDTFPKLGPSAVLGAPLLPPVSLSGWRRVGRAWVAADEHDDPVGFVLADVLDQCAHIEQVSVHPAYAGRHVGPALLDHVGRWAARNKLRALTLIAFRGVPWSAPYYERLGFREATDADITPGLAARMAAEAAGSSNPSALVCLRRDALPAAPGANL